MSNRNRKRLISELGVGGRGQIGNICLIIHKHPLLGYWELITLFL